MSRSDGDTLKLASHLACSRHGVYYYRYLSRIDGKRTERRISLRTKNPTVARALALKISVIMLQHQENNAAMGRGTFNPTDPTTWGGLDDIRKLDVVLPNGVQLRNVHTEEDAALVPGLIEKLGFALPQGERPVSELGKLVFPVATPAPVAPAPSIATPALAPSVEGGATITEMAARFATRKAKRLSSKALYEYGNYHRKFADWMAKRARNQHVPIRTVGRREIADFIDDLLAEGISSRTVQNKYLAALSGLFELAQSSASYPEGALPTRDHRIFTKRDKKQAEADLGYKPFTDDELKRIFKAENLLTRSKPCDFWLPLLGLFTGGRINELCQLQIADIQMHDDIWAISINEEEDKQLKTLAARRTIPIHRQLLELGFLDYVEDVTSFGVMLFPYLSRDKFGYYSKTPSRRYGEYLDKLEIRDRQKVFHSFRSTSNNCLKQNGVDEESRCQFIGHEHDTVNSRDYSDPHTLEFLLNNVASRLAYPNVDFSALVYEKGRFDAELTRLMRISLSGKRNKEVRELRGIAKKV